MLSWNIPSSQSPNSIIPMYYLSLENMTTKHQTGSCAASEYNVDLYLNEWFCFSPLLIRQAPARIRGYNTTVHGEIIFD